LGLVGVSTGLVSGRRRRRHRVSTFAGLTVLPAGEQGAVYQRTVDEAADVLILLGCPHHDDLEVWAAEMEDVLGDLRDLQAGDECNESTMKPQAVVRPRLVRDGAGEGSTNRRGP
jgi:hypothetical protein